MPAIGDIAELIVVYQGQYSQFINTFGFKALTTADDLAALAADFKANMIVSASGGLLNGVASTVSVSELHVRDVKPGTGASYDLAFSAVPGNDISGQELPPQDALVITWRTALGGRSYRGRSYWLGMTEQDQDNGVWNATIVGYANAWAQALLDRYKTLGAYANWELAIVSRFNNKLKRAVPVATPVTSFVVRPFVYSQRRRQIGRGR